MFWSLLQPYLPYITVGAGVLSIICLIIAIVALASSRRMKRRLSQWKDIASTSDLEDVFLSTKQAVKSIQEQMSDVEMALAQMHEALQRKVSTPVMQRYNAFAEVGSDLSYSVAFLDDVGDGVVLTSIYGRDDSVTYGKPVVHGDSEYLLTAEEQKVIESVMQHEASDKVKVKSL
ncbi:DUF4446 family protein [Alicyclobacillus suci]|uniref:DUF4446 family protein n=1 Tax=Alicyclobacillus suci TaxID=2816080 RepID=UPI001A8C7B75|nr:DUF4446 family protein [Alicyclobacillus suci]